MSHSEAQTARAVAAEVLNQFEPKRNYASPILEKLLEKTGEKQRATDLVFGTLRNRIALDRVISQFSGRRVERISLRLLNIIRIAAFELIYCPETPEYSIVNEAVKNVKAVGGKKQTDFVNAVLRQITRHITTRQIQLDKANPRSTLTQTTETGCQFDTDLLPNPETQQSDYLSICFSLPRWLINDWLGEFGFERTYQICLASNRRPGIYVRPNILKTSMPQLLEKLRQQDIEAEAMPGQSMIKVKSPQAIIQLPGFTEGLFTVQDTSAAQAVIMMNPQSDWRILDLCAAPGTKTTQLAETTNDSAEIIATDIDTQRLKKVKENAVRLGVKSIRTVSYDDIEKEATRIGIFDAVLLDVPCSNTGVLARRVEARFRLRPQEMEKIAKRQTNLLTNAAKLVKPGGVICYSTCSIQRCENSDVIGEFLQSNRDFELDCESLFLPSAKQFDHDGGFVAVIVRKL
jgi:16S rRNA (cytosine967-C5)-methyltransferase